MSAEASSIIKPRALKPGDTLAVISPAGATADAEAFDRGIALLEAEGFHVKLMPNARKRQLYLAGSDAERLADLHAAFADPAVSGILCARGGYGCMRLLPQLDFELIARNPKVFIGFSDITSLLIPFYQRCGLMGFYGPMLTSNLASDADHPESFSQAELLRMVRGEIQPPFTIPNRDTYHAFTSGMAEAPLVGGNLSLLSALCGTPFQPVTRGHILFIEDWREQYYSLDRQFQQLRMAGLFDGIAGLLLCDFSEIDPDPVKPLPDFLHSLVTDLAVPTGYGFSVGHGSQTATLPMGCRARFEAETGTLTLLEAPTSG